MSFIFALLTAVFVLAIDRPSHPHVLVGVLYVPIVAALAWRQGWRYGVGWAAVCALAHAWSDEAYMQVSGNLQFVRLASEPNNPPGIACRTPAKPQHISPNRSAGAPPATRRGRTSM